MEFFLGILPFFNAGLVGAVVGRFSGINLSMVILLIIIYMGARPEEAVVAMLTFNAYNYFTAYTQLHRLSLKNLTFFPGWKMIIPTTLSCGLIILKPFAGLTLFVIFFLAEIFADIYKKMDPKERPAIKEIVKMSIIASVIAVIGVAVVPFVPQEWFFLLAGIVILLLAYLMWRAGDRSAMRDSWDKILYGVTFFLGLLGIECVDWMDSMHRNNRSALARSYVIVINAATIVALVVAYILYHYFSVGALFTCIGSALGIRLFGVTEYDGKGKFSYLTLGLVVLAVLIFFLTQPVPVGFPELPGVSEI